IERFVKAARERNIRFCYVRLLTFAGADAVTKNAEFLGKITRGIMQGSAWTGGDLRAGAAKRYAETGVSAAYFVVIALGVAAGVVWMLRAFCPLPDGLSLLLLALLCVVCAALALLGETGRKLVALLAGVAFPAVACLRTF